MTDTDDGRPSPAGACGGAAPPAESGCRAGDVDCLGAVRQLWDCLDGELTEERLRVVRAHLERCARCHPHFDFERRFLDALAATRPDCCAPAELRERVVSALRAAGFEAS
ncbi:MAG: zf-HC2 domain-containing protein [Gemmatimonadaceae bacterium]